MRLRECAGRLHRALAPSPGRRAGRLAFVDATRGTAMIMVLVSHFGLTYFDQADPRGRWLETFTLAASPTFMLLSGILVGMLYRTRPDAFDRLRVRLADRGLFILFVAQGLILIGSWPFMHSFRYLHIINAIGVSMLVSPSLVAALPSRQRLAASACGFALSWMAVGYWHPHDLSGRLVREALFGSLHPTVFVFTFPILPWCCLDLFGTVLGERLGQFMAAGEIAQAIKWLRRVGARAIACGVVLKTGAVAFDWFARPFAAARWARLALSTLGTPHIKLPPSPAYLSFYGGIGLCLLSCWLAVERRGGAAALMDYMGALGQSSLFMFVAQFYVYYGCLPLFRQFIPVTGAWPIYLCGSIASLVLATLAWHRAGYQRFLTLGLVRWYEGKRLLAAPNESVRIAVGT